MSGWIGFFVLLAISVAGGCGTGLALYAIARRKARRMNMSSDWLRRNKFF